MAENTTTRVVEVQVDNAEAIKLIADYNAKIEESTAKEKALREAIKKKGEATAADREELAKLLNISDNQLGYVTNVPAGCGLIRCAGNIVPFTNSFPKNTKLYGLMTTKPDEVRKE